MLGWRISKHSDKHISCPAGSSAYRDNIDENEDMENLYIDAVMLVMNELKVNSLYIRELEILPALLGDNLYRSKIKAFKNNTIIALENIADILKLILREQLWCKLENELMYIHFEYDFNMYIGVQDVNSVVTKIRASGLNVEECRSPYL